MEFDLIMAKTENVFDEKLGKVMTDVTMMQRMTEQEYKQVVNASKEWVVTVILKEKTTDKKQ